MPYDAEIVPKDALKGEAKPRIFLQPIAAPSILGLFGLAGANFMVSALLCRWYGSIYSLAVLLPFVALFGGAAQFIAGIWAFRARDGVAAAIHGMWGAFWMAFAILAAVYGSGALAVPDSALAPAFGYWFIVLAAVTWTCAFASTAGNKALVTTLALLGAGAATLSIALLTGAEWLVYLGGYFFLFSSFAAWYTASALMINEAFGREAWPLGCSAEAQQRTEAGLAHGLGEPGVIRGQA